MRRSISPTCARVSPHRNSAVSAASMPYSDERRHTSTGAQASYPSCQGMRKSEEGGTSSYVNRRKSFL